MTTRTAFRRLLRLARSGAVVLALFASGPGLLAIGAADAQVHSTGHGAIDRGVEGAGSPAIPADPDVVFLEGMIPHHLQALEMTALVADRTQSAAVLLIARRIELSQEDEIALMSRALDLRRGDGAVNADERAAAGHARVRGGAGGDAGGPDHHGHHPTAGDHHAPHQPAAGASGPEHAHELHHARYGMLTAEEMAQLAATRGAEFDRLFLERMIRHHEGALVMVRELFATDTGGQAGEIFQLASHIDSDQRIEIARMSAVLAELN